ncbi:MAG: hypothetical protein MSJ26_10610 [Oscillospiraceae bacterium]|nr:hypothetical protein [Oscillospiraceae bacterium]
MKYPDYEFYRVVFCGSEEEDIIMPFIRAAGDILRGQLTTDVLSESDETELFRAVCAQADHMAENEGLSSVKLGDFSAAFSRTSVICPRAMAIIEAAGLIFRGGITIGR